MSRRTFIGFALSASLLALLLAVGLSGGTQPRLKSEVAAAATRYLTGVGDQNDRMFLDPNWRQLHARIARYIVPYDAAVSKRDLAAARLWIARAKTARQRILVAFYHSRRTATRLPSVATYQRDVRKFVRYFPAVREYQAWNEANRGNVKHMFSSPSAELAARYYAALRAVCRRCTITALDVLDQYQYRSTLRYIARFLSALRGLRLPRPRLWGLHNYSDTNRFRSAGTRAIVRAVGGTVWLTETGGIVKLNPSFPNRRGSGLRRAAKALGYMFRLAASNRHITRLYIFQWRSPGPRAGFDAGLTDARSRPRPGYVVVCRQLHAARCNVKTSQQ